TVAVYRGGNRRGGGPPPPRQDRTPPRRRNPAHPSLARRIQPQSVTAARRGPGLLIDAGVCSGELEGFLWGHAKAPACGDSVGSRRRPRGLGRLTFAKTSGNACSDCLW